MATLIVQNGTLSARDFIVAGPYYGRIRTMETTMNKKISTATPGTPIIITGLNYTPAAGDKFFGFQDEKFAKSLANEKAALDKADELKERSIIKVDGDKKTFNIIVKADVRGTSEAVKYALTKIANDEVQVNIVRASVGMVTKSDVLLAQASHATIFCFNIRPSAMINQEAKMLKVLIKGFTVIYKMIEEVETIISGMLTPKFEEKVVGEATIQKVIYYSKVGNIAGCFMNSGYIFSQALVRLIREGRIIFDGQLDSLQRGKDSVKKVEVGKDFGAHIKNYNDIKIGDVIEVYKMEEIKA